jgi:hypothetical protein
MLLAVYQTFLLTGRIEIAAVKVSDLMRASFSVFAKRGRLLSFSGTALRENFFIGGALGVS